MRHDAAAHLYFAPSMFDRYLDYAFVGVARGKVVARAFSVPFAFNIEGRAELPDGGWDEVIRWAHDDQMTGRAPNALSALEISLLPEARGDGNSLAFLGAMKTSAKAHGLAEMFAPVRPNQKHLHPFVPMRDYVDTVGADGFPTDSWLRTHLRAGARTREDCALFHDNCWQHCRLVTLDRNVVRSIGRGLDCGCAHAGHDFT